ncbi:hypothetical protein BCY91_00800 [Pelobium manganitolerans]|uniref:Fido domain-containing protein n=1 Tax=Pelobium manganitolerans TaxID=1842495 RepID=A0A419SC23_9SPHI|nr:Fic family protein [Pelobium manganitolerans]RKD20196.1 hypothetical protein BCY91_00800 [Pelobium manganitolerans]
MDLQILSTALLDAYLEKTPRDLLQRFSALEDAEISTPEFSFYTSVASVFSSKIEGECMELDSYVKHKKYGLSFQPDYTKKIDDLYTAYIFAQNNVLNEANTKVAHQHLSKHLITADWQGQYRNQNMYVTTDDGKIEYVAAEPHEVKNEVSYFFSDVETLLNRNLSLQEVFYFSAMIHLVFVKIHPWADGNGRSARLLEKWFMAEKLGAKAWFLQSEKMYYNNHQTYYVNLRRLGLEYSQLDYSKALPFLLMLPNTLNHQ